MRFRLGSAPDPITGELTALPRPLAGFQEAFRGRGGEGGKRREEENGKGRGAFSHFILTI